MCGIIGVLSSRSGAIDAIRGALPLLKHRGPDARAVLEIRAPSATCVFGHTRLRIIDLSPDADQPLSNEDHSVWVIYNGELYNHKELRVELAEAGHCFKSNSDTEVLVHLYEDTRGDVTRMLKRLRGMFAFAIFDSSNERLLLCRDRLGIKPLYWANLAQGIAFSSEARSLVQIRDGSSAPDLAAIASYLMWGVIHGPRTMFAGISDVPPGSFLECRRDALRIERWWRPEVRPNPELALEPEGLLQAVLNDSVARHLVADRPVGLFLSGGVDSASVAALASGRSAVQTLTVTFPEVSDDEGMAAAKTAGRFDTTHACVPVTGAEVKQAVPEILGAMDSPTSDGVNSWLISRAARQAGVVVALSGLGGDELFGGYPSFRLVPRVAMALEMFRLLPERMRSAMCREASQRNPGGRLARIAGSSAGYEGAYAAVRGLFAPPEIDWLPAVATNGSSVESAASDPSDRVMLLELNSYLPYQLLRDTDQMSMAHSIEVRVPLLDDRVVDVALALPAALRTASGKRLLACSVGLEDVARKRPFTLPFEHWMRGPLRETVKDALLSDELPFAHLIDASFRRRIWFAFEERRTHWSRPWSVAVLRLWPEANGFRW